MTEEKLKYTPMTADGVSRYHESFSTKSPLGNIAYEIGLRRLKGNINIAYI